MHRSKPIPPVNAHRLKQRLFGPAQRGQSITEYGMVGALVIVISIGALTLFGKNLTGVFGTLSSKTNDPSLVSVKPNLLAAPPISGPTTLNNSPLPTAISTPISVQATTQPLQTAGVNGETDQYSQNILKAAQQALAAGTINQSQYDIMLQMANQGHEIAIMEGLLQKSYQHPNQEGFYGTFVTYNGEPYTPAVFSRMLNDANNTLQLLHTQLLSTNPAAADVVNTVTDATVNIEKIAASHTQAMDNADSATIEQLLGNNNASTVTNQKSASICAAGQHLDVNNHCVN